MKKIEVYGAENLSNILFFIQTWQIFIGACRLSENQTNY